MRGVDGTRRGGHLRLQRVLLLHQIQVQVLVARMQRVIRHRVRLGDNLALLLGGACLEGEIPQLLGLLLDLVGAQERWTVGDALEDVRLVDQLLLITSAVVVLAA